MAITQEILVQGGLAAFQTSYETAPFDAPSGRLIRVGVGSTSQINSFNTIPSCTGLGATWQLIHSRPGHDGEELTSAERLTCFWSVLADPVEAGTLTFAWPSNQRRVSWSVEAYPGALPSGLAIGQIADAWGDTITNLGPTLTMTLAEPLHPDGVIVSDTHWLHSNIITTVAHPAGWITFRNQALADTFRHAMWRGDQDDASPTHEANATPNNKVGIALELIPTPLPPPLPPTGAVAPVEAMNLMRPFPGLLTVGHYRKGGA